MARFMGWLKGRKGEVSRLGTAPSGLFTCTNGWELGVTVKAFVNSRNEDVFTVSITGGSNNSKEEAIFRVSKEKGTIQLYLDKDFADLVTKSYGHKTSISAKPIVPVISTLTVKKNKLSI